MLPSGMSSATSAATAQRRQQIVEGTRRLFAQYGHRRTGMDDIAREAGVAKGTYAADGAKHARFHTAKSYRIELRASWPWSAALSP